MQKILNKLVEARNIIKSSDLKKAGHNEYSNFDYYTPEQVESLVDNACKLTKTICLCNLRADEFGLFQTLDFVDLESDERLVFEMRTKHGNITATNETQQMGGTDTYSERYIKMKVFQIKDNNLDPDSQTIVVDDKRKKVITSLPDEVKTFICPVCKKEHHGKYPKCLDCFKAGKEVPKTKEIINPNGEPFPG